MFEGLHYHRVRDDNAQDKDEGYDDDRDKGRHDAVDGERGVIGWVERFGVYHVWTPG